MERTSWETAISNSLIAGNSVGIWVNGRASAMVTLCTISGNDSVGVYVSSGAGTGNVPARATLESCTIAYNAIGIQAYAAGGDNTARIYIAPGRDFV